MRTQALSTCYVSESSSEFIISLLVCETLLNFTLPLSINLQTKTLDLISALDSIDIVVKSLENVRSNADNFFHGIYESAKKLKKQVFDDDSIQKPRVINRMKYRDNHETQTTEDYFRITCFLPCLDTLKEHLKTRFSIHSKTPSAFQSPIQLIQSIVVKY